MKESIQVVLLLLVIFAGFVAVPMLGTVVGVGLGVIFLFYFLKEIIKFSKETEED